MRALVITTATLLVVLGLGQVAVVFLACVMLVLWRARAEH